MATRFTRVTIAGEDRQVDVSLPAAAPVAEQLPMVLRLLSIPSTPVPRRWVLSTPELGVLPRDRSLDDTGILDGMVLFLTEAPEAAAPPFVDDVESAAAETVAEIAPPFTGNYRRSGVAGLLALVLLVACWVSLSAPSPISWLGAALAGVAALAIGALVSERGGAFVAAMAIPAAATLVYTVDSKVNGVTPADLMLILTAAALALVAVGLVRQTTAATAGGIAATVLAVACWICLYAGLPPYRAAGLLIVLTVLGCGLAGQFALGGAGLVNLMVADERGQKVPRLAVDRALRRGEGIATGVVWACSVAAAAAVLVLLRTLPAATGDTAGGISPVFGAIAAAVFGLRSRMFSRTKQVVPMIGVAVVGAAGAATMVPAWVSMTNPQAATAVALGLLALTALLLGTTGFAAMAEVPRARMRRSLEALEFLTVLALVPGLILLFNAIAAIKGA